MLTKSKAKLIRQLHEKKYRTESKLFLVEGEKAVAELLQSDFIIEDLFVTAEFHKKYRDALKNKGGDYSVVEQQEIENIGTLESNDAALAVVQQKENTPLSVSDNEIVLALDTIRDPGNLGTIIRIADWYGITKIVCSETTTDFYNSKTIAASMGSFTRVQLFYTQLEEYLKMSAVPILGAFLEGDNVHTLSFPQGGILLMGNESNGISDSLSPLITQKISIPKFGNAESLNVSIATAVILDNWKRSK
jgi:TrmH family RNA methyltransferase